MGKKDMEKYGCPVVEFSERRIASMCRIIRRKAISVRDFPIQVRAARLDVRLPELHSTQDSER